MLWDLTKKRREPLGSTTLNVKLSISSRSSVCWIPPKNDEVLSDLIFGQVRHPYRNTYLEWKRAVLKVSAHEMLAGLSH